MGLGDGLARVVAQNRIEYETSGRNDADVLAELFVATPRFALGRFVFEGLLHDRYENYLNRYFELGGDTQLRGYPATGYADSVRGPLAVALNAEFRTRSIDLLSVHTGLAAFYDAGDATDAYSNLYLRQSAGVGLRLLFAQFDRVVLRADWAFPFNPPPGYSTFPGGFYIAYQQAIPVPELSSPSVMKPDLR